MAVFKGIFRHLLSALLLTGIGFSSPARAVLLHGITAQNRLVSFDSSTPGKLRTSLTVTGLQAGEAILGIDVRPVNGVLYGLSGAGRLYMLDPDTGSASLAAVLAADPTDLTAPFTALSGASFGVDFNPVPDRLRVVSNTGQNLRINPVNGLVITDGTLNPGTPALAASAYTNNFAGTTTTTLYGIDATANTLMIQNPPNNGTLVPVGPLGVDVADTVGFDIFGNGNVGFAAMTPASATSSRLYTINLTTGASTLVEVIGPGNSSLSLRGLAAAPGNCFALTTENELVSFEAATPNLTSRPIPITGLLPNESLLGIDVRPANGQLYALGGAGLLYTLNTQTGAATLAANLSADPTDQTSPYTQLSGVGFGVDFNPLADRLRVVTGTGNNLRINPENGRVVTDGEINPGDPSVTASAYTNNYSGAANTTLYGIDTVAKAVVVQNPPNNGTLLPVGSLNIHSSDLTPSSGFDIVGLSNRAYAALKLANFPLSGLFSINLATGAVTVIGPIGTQDDIFVVQGLAIMDRPLKGDVNGDDAVDVADAIRILRHLVDLEALVTYQQRIGDMNNSGTVTVEDAVIVLRKAVGLS